LVFRAALPKTESERAFLNWLPIFPGAIRKSRRIKLFKGGTWMKARNRIFSRVGWLLVLSAVLIPAKPAFAQEDNRVPAAFMGAFLLIFCIIFLVAYVYHALALQTIATKTNTENPWFAWIPIVNIILMLNIAKKPIWWILLFLIPLANIVIYVLLWMGIAEARNKPNWWGILIIVPVVNIIVPGYLAWSD
jgi:succinate dehydrogenase hydrophobic anchor subunit